MSPMGPSSLQSSFCHPFSSTNSPLSYDVNVDDNPSQDPHSATILSSDSRQTNWNHVVEDTGSIEKATGNMDDFEIDQQSNVRRGTLLSPSQTALPENSSETTPQYLLMQNEMNYRDHTDLFRDTFAEDVNRRSFSYAGFRPDNSDEELSTSYGRSHKNSNGNQISEC